MTYDEIVAMVEEIGLPNAYDHFAEGESPPPPFVIFLLPGTDNFMGRPAVGYEQPLVVMTKEAAEGCVKAAEILRKQGYIMKFYDAYRPQRAVDDFCAWGEDSADQRRKPVHYPNVEKLKMFDDG